MEHIPHDPDQEEIYRSSPEPAARGIRIVMNWAAMTLTALRSVYHWPIPVFSFETNPDAQTDLTNLPRILPVVGAVIAMPAAAIFPLAVLLGLSSTIAAALAMTTSMFVTSALHEHRLLSFANMFGSEKDGDAPFAGISEKQSAAVGIAALVIVLILRVAAVSDLGDIHGSWGAAAAIIAVGALSHLAAVIPMHILPPVDEKWGGGRLVQPAFESMAYGALIAMVIAAFILALAGFGGRPIAEAVILSLASTLPLVWLAKRISDGQTADVAGAAQQVAEAVALIALLMR